MLFRSESLEDAQQNKINHIIKKLNLGPGQKVLDIGCGWGGMAFEIARQSQCEVTGISLSENQINYCKKKGIEAKIHYPIPMYRQPAMKFLKHKKGDFPITDEHCKKIISFPCDQHLSKREINYLINIVKLFYWMKVKV